MKAKKKILLVGGGGHCMSCIDVIESTDEYAVGGIIDIQRKLGDTVLGYEIIGCDNDLEKMRSKFDYALVTIGQITSNDLKRKLFALLRKLNYEMPVIIAKTAYVSKHATIKEGTIIMHQAMVNAGVKIGANSIVNNKALIEHECVIGSHCHISTGACLNGRVKVNSDTFIGSNSCLVQNVEVTSNVKIGANATVTKNITKPGTYVGSPAKLIK